MLLNCHSELYRELLRTPQLNFLSPTPDTLNFIHTFFAPSGLKEILRRDIPGALQDPLLFFLKDVDHTINLIFAEAAEVETENHEIDDLLKFIDVDVLPDLDEKYPKAKLNRKENEELFFEVKARSALLIARKRSKTKELIKILERIIPKFATNAKSSNGSETKMQVNKVSNNETTNPFYFQEIVAAQAKADDYEWYEPREFNPFHCLVASLYMAYKNIGKNTQADDLLNRYPEISPATMKYYESAYGRINTYVQI